MKYKLLGLLTAGVMMASAAPAVAATVTLRVEGRTSTIVPAQRVTLPTAEFKPDGTNGCAPDSVGGALQVATGANWGAQHFSIGYFLNRVANYSPTGDDSFAIAINNVYTLGTVCDPGIKDNDSILVYTDFCTYDAVLGDCSNQPVLPLEVTDVSVRPAIYPGSSQSYTLKVTRYAHDGTSAPVAGATITGGDAPVTTDANGIANVALTTPGPAILTASKEGFVRKAFAACSTNGLDGACGGPAAQPPAPCVTNGHDGLCGSPDKQASYGFITAVKEGAKYSRTKAPRTLSGRVDPDPSGLADVRLRLTRNDGGKCSYYSGRKEKFATTKKCGAPQGKYFSLGAKSDWSYLLPSKLAKGRYVLDVLAVDKAGNPDDKLARGRNRVVFRVA